MKCDNCEQHIDTGAVQGRSGKIYCFKCVNEAVLKRDGVSQ